MPTPPKAKHKHTYDLHLMERDTNLEHFDLVKICSICGRVKPAQFRQCLTKRENGSWKWMVTLDDFREVYGDLPVIRVNATRE